MGEKFAASMNSLFIETSAKTSLHVKEAFTEVVEKILDTPELWTNHSITTRTDNGRGGVPGGVQLVGGLDDKNDAGGGCSC